MTPQPSARVHLLPAREAPYVVVLRRGPSKRVHVMRWNTLTDEIEHGSWFQGRLYEYRCDVSFDGEWMVYLAMGSRGETWSGLCRPPFLRTTLHWDNEGTWHGGGFFDASTLLANAGYASEKLNQTLSKAKVVLPFRIEVAPHSPYGEDEGVLYPRLARDGWKLDREGSREWRKGWGTKPREDCPRWSLQPTPKHPVLLFWYRGYETSKGRVFEFGLPDHPDLIDTSVTWAAYDAHGQLVLARAGVLERYTLDDLPAGNPSFRYDTNLDLPPIRNGERVPREDKDEDEPERLPVYVFEGTATDASTAGLALLHPSGEETDALRIAGPDAEREFGSRVRDDTPFATDPYYLRHHILLHTVDREGRIEALLDAAQSYRLPSLALGSALTQGCEGQSVEAAIRWLEGGNRIEITFVADGPEQAAALTAAIEASQ